MLWKKSSNCHRWSTNKNWLSIYVNLKGMFTFIQLCLHRQAPIWQLRNSEFNEKDIFP